jgi:rubrerythrin
VLLLLDVCRKTEPEVFQAYPMTQGSDWMSRHVIQHAAVFEAVAAKRYQELAAGEKNSRRREIYEWLAKEENTHLNAMKSGMLVSDKDDEIVMTEAIIGDMPPIKKLFLKGGDDESSSRQQILDVIEGEKAQEQFYKALATHCKIPRLSDAFAALAVAEGRHVEKLQDLLD